MYVETSVPKKRHSEPMNTQMPSFRWSSPVAPTWGFSCVPAVCAPWSARGGTSSVAKATTGERRQEPPHDHDAT